MAVIGHHTPLPPDDRKCVCCSRGLLKAGPQPTARDGPAARWPSPDFPQFFCPAVNPRACTDLHRVWACKMDDGEFEFVYHFNNHFNPIRPFLSLHVAK